MFIRKILYFLCWGNFQMCSQEGAIWRGNKTVLILLDTILACQSAEKSLLISFFMIEWILEWSRLANKLSKLTKNVPNLSIKALNEVNQSVIFRHILPVILNMPYSQKCWWSQIVTHGSKHVPILYSPLSDVKPTYMTLDKLLRLVMSFLCHFE